jgi:hypothetical protein
VEASVSREEILRDGEIAARDAEVIEFPESTTAPVEPLPEIQIVTLDAFADVDESGAEALVGSADNALIPVGGDVMFYGDGGAGKTTLAIDLACHLAAGDDWLGVPVARPVRVLLVENEGPRPLFRLKLRRKRDNWGGSPIGDRIMVLEAPWGRINFSDAECRDRLTAAIREHEIDVVIVGPVTRSGMNEAGTLQEVRDFMALVDDVRTLSVRHVVVVLIHHENKGGQVSGAWEGAGDTLFHVQAQGHGRTRLYVQKARWSSEQHGTTMQLLWADGDGFTVEDKPEVDDETLAEQIVAVIAADPGLSWGKVEEATPGVARERRRAARDGLLQAGQIVNIAKSDDGTLVALDHCPERKPARLYPAGDPTIIHLRPERGAAAAQAAPLWGEGTEAPLRRAPRPIRGAGVAAQFQHPSEPRLPGDPGYPDWIDEKFHDGHIVEAEWMHLRKLHASRREAAA